MNHSSTYQGLTMVLLAGGQSTRMGTDKGFLILNHSSFSNQLVQLGNIISNQVFVSVGSHNRELYKELDVVTVLDVKPEKGPMGGIISVLPLIKTKWFMVVSVDTPLVTKEIISELWGNKTGFEAVVFESKNRIHPLVGLYQTNSKAVWQKAFTENKLKVTTLVESLNVNKVAATKKTIEQLKNINTPKEYEELIK